MKANITILKKSISNIIKEQLSHYDKSAFKQIKKNEKLEKVEKDRMSTEVKVDDKKVEFLEALTCFVNEYNTNKINDGDLLTRLLEVGKYVKAKKSVVENNLKTYGRRPKIYAFEVAQLFLDTNKEEETESKADIKKRDPEKAKETKDGLIYCINEGEEKREKQIQLLKQHGIKNYSVENGKITINGSLYLSALQKVDKDFLKGTTIKGFLDLSALQKVDKDFLIGTTINGFLDLNGLRYVDKDFLKGTTINGFLDLRVLRYADKDFIKGTTINGSLYLSALQKVDQDFLKGTTINGDLDLSALRKVDKDFLKGTTINGSLYLGTLQNADKDFLKGTTINGYLSLNSLQNADKDKVRKNIKQLKQP